jgi:hypothetical protein
MNGKFMHFEILVEDLSGKIALEVLIPKIMDDQKHTYSIISHKGIGHLPKNLKGKSDVRKQTLLDRLPKMLQAYGKTFINYDGVVIVVCDLDERCLKTFRQELLECLSKCDSPPSTYFCFAVEEIEAWYLGDQAAIQKAYPKVNLKRLKSYRNDSICATWEQLAEAILNINRKKIAQMKGHDIGKEKANWAENIPPYMNIENNQSPSFCYFRDKIRNLINHIT